MPGPMAAVLLSLASNCRKILIMIKHEFYSVAEMERRWDWKLGRTIRKSQATILGTQDLSCVH